MLGVDIHEYFHGTRPWPQLIRFVSKLGQGTRYHSALMADEEFAEAMLAQYIEEDRARKPGQPDPVPEANFVGYTRGIELMTAIINAILQNTHVTGSVFGGGGGKPPQLPYPRSLFERKRDRYDNEYSDNLAARFGLD